MRDTLSALRELESAGIDSMHAEAMVGVIAKAHEQVATKADLEHAAATTKTDLEHAVTTMRAELENAVTTMRAELAAAVAALEARLEARIERAMNRNLLATIAVGGVIIAAVKLL